jgi:hypothetical protein
MPCHNGFCPNCLKYLLWKTKTDDVTPAKAGGQSEKAGFPLEFIPHTMRGGNPGTPGLFPQQELNMFFFIAPWRTDALRGFFCFQFTIFYLLFSKVNFR